MPDTLGGKLAGLTTKPTLTLVKVFRAVTCMGRWTNPQGLEGDRASFTHLDLP